MERLADEMLVSQTLNGEQNAFSELISRYEKQIYSLAYRLTNNRDDAQDLAQEAFIKIYCNLEKYDDGRPFFPWMYKVAVNVCYSRLRQNKPLTNETTLEKVIDFSPLIPDKTTHPEEYYDVKETQDIVNQAVAELPERYRLPLVLKYLEDMSYKEISEILYIPVTTVETRLYRGRALLKKRLTSFIEGGKHSEVSGE